MATNITQKDQTLNAVIDWCKAYQRELAEKYVAETHPLRVIKLKGMSASLGEVIAHCYDMLGYGGSMPTEVPNQAKDAK